MITKLLRIFAREKKSENTITSMGAMTLILRGMRGGTVYKFDGMADQTELCRYYEKYSDGKDILELERSTACDIETMIRIMNNCNVIGWNGFHGRHPKNVHDGIMFRFDATVNRNITIHADGSENFPKGYREFVRALNAELQQGYKNAAKQYEQ